MIILTDVDGVLVDFVGGVCSDLRKSGENVWPSHVKSWELSHTFSDRALGLFGSHSKRKGFCYELEWYKGALGFLAALRRLGDVHAVTAPLYTSEHWMAERMKSLGDMAFTHDHVHFTAGRFKHLVRGDVLIEDHPKTAADWCRVNKRGHAILIDRPWNQPIAKEYDKHPRVIRVCSYDQAVRAIESIAQRKAA